MKTLETERMILRPWKIDDLEMEVSTMMSVILYPEESIFQGKNI